MQCAKCHDHKFDPILQKDYYRLRAFFAAIIPDDRVVASELEQREYAEKMKEWEAATAALRSQIEAIEAPYRAKAAIKRLDVFLPTQNLRQKTCYREK